MTTLKKLLGVVLCLPAIVVIIFPVVMAVRGACNNPSLWFDLQMAGFILLGALVFCGITSYGIYLLLGDD